MKCPRCRGYGRAIVLVKQKEGFYGTEQTVCPECNGKGIIEQTNEEWFCSLTTKEKAEWLYSAMFENGFKEKIEDIAYMNMQAVEDEIYCWLKEKHTDEMPIL